MKCREKKLWEELSVVWLDAADGSWYLTRVTNHNADGGASSTKYVTRSELYASLLREGAVKAASKQEAMLKHAVLGGRGAVWSVDCVYYQLNGDSGGMVQLYRLAKEDF